MESRSNFDRRMGDYDECIQRLRELGSHTAMWELIEGLDGIVYEALQHPGTLHDPTAKVWTDAIKRKREIVQAMFEGEQYKSAPGTLNLYEAAYDIVKGCQTLDERRRRNR